MVVIMYARLLALFAVEVSWLRELLCVMGEVIDHIQIYLIFK